MRRNLFQRLPGATGPVVFAVATFILLWQFSRLDFDRHHDGYMLAQAIAVHQGGAVHAGVVAQYGPVTPWVQSLAMYLPIGPGLALRTMNVVFISVTVFFLADMGRRTPANWPVSRAAGWWSAIAWIVLADVWLGKPMLPWSSTLATMLSVAVLYLLTRSIRYAGEARFKAAGAAALSSGALLGLIPFTRINVGLSAVAICLVVAVVILVTDRGSHRPSTGLFILGMFLSSLTVIAILVGTDSLADFYSQAIREPLAWGQYASAGWYTRDFLTSTVGQQAIPVALVGTGLFLLSRARTMQRELSALRSGMGVFAVLIGVIVVIWERFHISYPFSEDSEASKLISRSTSYDHQYLYFFLVLALFLAVLTLLRQTREYFPGRSSGSETVFWVLLGGLTLSGLTQIIPTWDVRHVWWGSPVGLLLIFSVVDAKSKLNRLSGNPLMLPLIAAAVVAVSSAAVYSTSERVPGRQGTIVEGMFVSEAQFSRINEDTDFLRRHLPGNVPVVYLAQDGDLSILDGTYRSADAYFVEWGGAPPVGTRIGNGDPIVVQRSAYSAKRVNTLARSIRYKAVARNKRLVLLMPVRSGAKRDGQGELRRLWDRQDARPAKPGPGPRRLPRAWPAAPRSG